MLPDQFQRLVFRPRVISRPIPAIRNSPGSLAIFSRMKGANSYFARFGRWATLTAIFLPTSTLN